MELTQEKLKTGIKNQMQHFLEYVYLSGQLDPYGSGDIRMQDDAKTPCLCYRGAEHRSNAFYRALGEIGPDGLRDLILQEHLRWNVTYLAEGIEFGPKKDLEGWETGRKTSPWIVSAEELWERSQQREKSLCLIKKG